MTAIRWLAVLPFLGMLIGPVFLNRVQPLVLGMPLLLAWLVMWVVLTSVIMAVIYAFDPANREKPREAAESERGAFDHLRVRRARVGARAARLARQGHEP